MRTQDGSIGTLRSRSRAICAWLTPCARRASNYRTISSVHSAVNTRRRTGAETAFFFVMLTPPPRHDVVASVVSASWGQLQFDAVAASRREGNLERADEMAKLTLQPGAESGRLWRDLMLAFQPLVDAQKAMERELFGPRADHGGRTREGGEPHGEYIAQAHMEALSAGRRERRLARKAAINAHELASTLVDLAAQFNGKADALDWRHTVDMTQPFSSGSQSTGTE